MKDMDILHGLPQKATKMLQRLEQLSCQERLRKGGQLRLEKRLRRISSVSTDP